MFPIALAVAEQASLNTRPFAIVILFGATLSFLTPIGYQTNTLVWSMGGYKYGDFARLGAPLTLLTLVMILVMVPLFFPLRQLLRRILGSSRLSWASSTDGCRGGNRAYRPDIEWA